MKPCEDYVFQNFLKIQKKLEAEEEIHLKIIEDTQSFFLSHTDFTKQYKKPPIMEYFYRFMRKKEDILMNGNTPEGDQWNFDKENRKFDKNHEKSWDFHLQKNSYVIEAEKYYDFEVKFNSPTNRKEALALLEYFVEHHLDTF